MMSGLEFARKQLEKYGWKDGEGLGKNKTGISKALKPKLKFDTGGLGHNVYNDVDNTWWQKLYDEAAKNIVTKKDQNNSVVLETVHESIEITTKKKSKRKITEENVYKDFVKISKLDKYGETKTSQKVEDVKPEPKKMTSGICELTDEELFKACGGRTVHKGARHGLKMNAKLARIEEQEKGFGVSCPLEQSNEDKVKKNKKKKKNKKEKL